MMYSKPEVRRLGDFRQLTQIGPDNNCDSATIIGAATNGNLPGPCARS